MGRIVFLALCLMLMATASYAGTTERVSVDSYGNQANGGNESPSISADGRYVAFESYATNLVPGDTNGASDVFVHDRQTGMTERVSVDSNGNQANSGNNSPSISADGRYVAFESYATNLVPGDTNGAYNYWMGLDIFVHDRQTGVTERVNVDSNGNQATNGSSYFPSISADGRFVAFSSNAGNLVLGDTNSMYDIFIHDRQTGVTERVSIDSNGNQANGDSNFSSISADGRYVAFSSLASNLVLGDANDSWDVFVHDRQTGMMERVSVDSNGNEMNGSWFPIHFSISADGRYVAFESYATNLVPGDTNGAPDVFVHDRQTGMTERVSVDSNGNQADNVNLYCGNYYPSISSDGRFIAFFSCADDLVAGDTNGSWDVFVHDRQTGMTERVSVDSDGNQANGVSTSPSISADGGSVAFLSGANNLVIGDTNNRWDIFVHDRGPKIPGNIEELSAAIGEFLSSGDISNAGIAASLTATLDNALKAQESGNTTAASNMLLAFINKVEAQSGKMITEEAAAILIEAANQILKTL